jgi:hypothetical protein
MAGVNSILSNLDAAPAFDASGAHEILERYAGLPPAAFARGIEKFRDTIREAVAEAKNCSVGCPQPRNALKTAHTTAIIRVQKTASGCRRA